MILSVLALSSRFDGQKRERKQRPRIELSVLALSSRFDGQLDGRDSMDARNPFSTRSVESF